MCLAVPMKLVTRDGQTGIAESDGVRATIALTLCPDAAIGDWLIIHAGYALSILDEDAADETRRLLAEVMEAPR